MSIESKTNRISLDADQRAKLATMAFKSRPLPLGDSYKQSAYERLDPQVQAYVAICRGRHKLMARIERIGTSEEKADAGEKLTALMRKTGPEVIGKLFDSERPAAVNRSTDW